MSANLSDPRAHRYLVRHGINNVYVGNAILSQELIPYVEDGNFEWRQHEYIGEKTGTRVMVKKYRKEDIIIHFVMTKLDDGWLRQIVLFKENDPYPVDIDEETYLSV